MSGIYGSIVSAPDVSDAVETFLRTWMPSYLAEVGAQHDLERAGDGSLPPIEGWTRSSSGLESLVASPYLPACGIVCPGIVGGIRQKGDGTVSAEFAVGVAFIVSARTQDETNTILGYYVSAARAAILQHPTLDGFASATRWVDERMDQLKPVDARTLAGGQVNLGVTVDAVLNSLAGPQEPPADPSTDPGAFGTVTEADVVTERLA